MQPLELSCITRIWNSALSILKETVSLNNSDIQLWFPWGKAWRGHDLNGSLPTTNLPEDLLEKNATRFGGRIWKTVAVNGTNWLLSFRAPSSATEEINEWEPSEKAMDALKMLADFVRLECLFGLTLSILENKSVENTGHWDRVRNFSIAIGSEMGLSSRELADIEVAALLHDIGKIGLSNELLETTQPLGENDRKAIESHSIIGSGMIKMIPGMEMVAEIIMSHHESADGSGYPHNLKQEEIPVGSLIIAVADAFDAMTHYRPYAIERTYYQSFCELQTEKGKYSPEVLAALERVLKRLGILETKPLVGNVDQWQN